MNEKWRRAQASRTKRIALEMFIARTTNHRNSEVKHRWWVAASADFPGLTFAAGGV